MSDGLTKDDTIEVRKAGDPNDGRAGKVDKVLPGAIAWPCMSPAPRYDIAFEGGLEHGEYSGRELVKVPPYSAKAGA